MRKPTASTRRPTATETVRRGRRRTVAPRVLKDIIARVVAAARPERIILFGSAARGSMGPNSDVDLLVVKGGKFDRGKLTTTIYHHLYGADAAVDVVGLTPEEGERYRDAPCLGL